MNQRLVDVLGVHGLVVVISFVDGDAGRVIDSQAKQFGPAVVPAGIHERLAPVDQREVQIGDHVAFTGPQGST